MSDLIPPLDHITFRGRETENVTEFLQNVKKVAFAQGHQRDHEWLIDYVETCLADEALKWYTSLDEETQSNFDRLRIAMIERFPVTAASTPLAPAAVAPSSNAQVHSLSNQSNLPLLKKQRGRIAIVWGNDLSQGYCGPEHSNYNPNQWRCDQTFSESEATVVELCPSSDPSKHTQSLLSVVVSFKETTSISRRAVG
ncbi:hypothetical protein FRB97_009278 [Tulasnella sp. 331]|nr:hypothetical protein FRB97_009278 [Tulasnella sp. 331]